MTDLPPDSAPATDRVLVLPHTHWDREWYHEAGRFRQRLVALVDELLDLPPAEAPPAFLLDGQAIVLEDYLAVRPERRDALAAALRAGRLEGGPWYVLADNLIAGGEALVRNLLAGRAVLAALGATPPPVCYAPDAFGHPAALPTLAAGFGHAVVVVWRGYGGARWPAGDAAWWRAPDGSRALLHHLPPDGYEFGSRLPVDAEGARARWAALRDVLAPRARLGVLLVQNGADHHALQERWPGALAALAAAAAPLPVEPTSLAAWAGLLATRAPHVALPEVAGELRDSTGHTWALQGTFASRAAQKRRVRQAERRLVRDVEPWLALLRLRAVAGDDAPHDTSATARRAAQARALLDAAWRPLLRCLPHDTLCGCSTDAVARAMDARLDDADAQARGLRHDALAATLGHDPVAARAARDRWRPTLVVRNRAARARGGVVEATLDAFVRDVGVGPGSAGQWRRATDPLARLALHAADGRALHVQPLSLARTTARLESPRHYPDVDLVDRTTALVWLPGEHAVPGYGLAALPAPAEPSGGRPQPSMHEPIAQADGPTHPVRVAGTTLDNGRVTVSADARGRVTIGWPAIGATWKDCLGLEDVGDAGDLYTPSLVGEARTTAWCDAVRVVHRGPLRGELLVALRLRVPAALVPAGDALSRPTQALRRHVELPVELSLSLDADASFVRIAIRGENRAHDHRLRLVVRTPVRDGRVHADAAFGPVARATDAPPRVPDAVPPEVLPATAPLHRWVTLHDAARGATLVADGLAEYEARADGALCVTLVRGVGELSRPDLPERPGHAGWPTPTPEAQDEGAFAARLAVAAHGPWDDDVATAVERLADDVLLPLVGETWRDLLDAPPAVPGLALEGEGLAFSAALDREDGVHLRCVNVTGRAVHGAWRIGAAVREAWRARLDGTREAALVVEGGAGTVRVPFVAGPREVVTVVVR